jgi:hypothetical protein
MSWIDKLNNSKFKIQTGDGKEYTPLWKNANKEKEYNYSSFEFINKEGTYIDRRKPKSAKYNLVLYFQGDDYLDLCDQFEKSASDPRYWTVEHPLYGTITGQPLSLARADNTYNNTEITVEFWETILTGVPKKSNSIQDDIAADRKQLIEDSSVSFASNVKLAPIDQSRMQGQIDHINIQSSPILNDANKEEFRSRYGKAKSATTKILDDAYNGMKQINELVSFSADYKPDTFEDVIVGVVDFFGLDKKFETEISVVQKIAVMYDIYKSVKEDLFTKQNRNNKSFFESIGSSIVSAVCQIALEPNEEDYISRKDVEKASESVNELYNDYVVTMDQMQSPIEDLINAFSLDYNVHSGLSAIINKTLYNLYDIAFNSKQERSIEIEKDTNLIILTHKYFGLDEEDKNIEKFRKLNNIVNDRIFGVKKGTVIKYLE